MSTVSSAPVNDAPCAEMCLSYLRFELTTNRWRVHAKRGYPDARFYTGEWDGSEQAGAASFDGWWVERPHGLGKMVYPDARVQEGRWEQGKFLGP